MVVERDFAAWWINASAGLRENGGIVEKHGKGRKLDEPKEWRAWSKMYGWERELAFDTMKVCSPITN